MTPGQGSAEAFDLSPGLNRDVMRENGFQYYPMGRPPVENKLRLKTRA